MRKLLSLFLILTSLLQVAHAKNNTLKICENNDPKATLTIAEKMGVCVLMSAGIEEAVITKEQARIHILNYLIVNNGTMMPKVENLCEFSDDELSSFSDIVCSGNLTLTSANVALCKRRITKMLETI